jgi:hypothetical protein
MQWFTIAERERVAAARLVVIGAWRLSWYFVLSIVVALELFGMSLS